MILVDALLARQRIGSLKTVYTRQLLVDIFKILLLVKFMD